MLLTTQANDDQVVSCTMFLLSEVRAMSTVSVWRDNLTIGLFLVARPYGAPLDDVLRELGYNPEGSYPASDRNRHVSRLQRAQAVGNARYVERVPGYFTIHAQPFGTVFLYRAVWYVWVNPRSQVAQAVLVAEADIESMQRRRAKDLATREKTTRSIRTARGVQRQRAAIADGNAADLYQLQAEMITDETFGELITNQLGLPYAEVAPVLDQIANGNPFSTMQFNFTKSANKMRKLQTDLVKEQAAVVRQLSSWIMLKTGLPSNAGKLALQDARKRLTSL